jgi:hypothetical protein
MACLAAGYLDWLGCCRLWGDGMGPCAGTVLLCMTELMTQLCSVNFLLVHIIYVLEHLWDLARHILVFHILYATGCTVNAMTALCTFGIACSFHARCCSILL